MKVLKDPAQVLDILNAKLKELHKRFDEAGNDEATEISGQEVAIICIAEHVRYLLDNYKPFKEEDMAGVYKYVNDAKAENYEHRNPRDTLFERGRAEGAVWALKEIEKRMEEG